MLETDSLSVCPVAIVWAYTIIIDDSPAKFLHSIPGNVLHVPSFSDGFGFVDGYVDTVLLAWLQPMLWILRESIVDGHLVDVPEFLEVALRPNEDSYVRAELEGSTRVVEPSKAMLQTWLGRKTPGSEGLSADIVFRTEQDVGDETPLVSEVAWEIWKGRGVLQELKKGDSCSIFMDPKPGTTAPRILGRGVVVEEKPLAVVGAGLGSRQALSQGFAYIRVLERNERLPKGSPSWMLCIPGEHALTYSELAASNCVRWPIQFLRPCDNVNGGHLASNPGGRKFYQDLWPDITHNNVLPYLKLMKRRTRVQEMSSDRERSTMASFAEREDQLGEDNAEV
ncbi:unnamed protein product [Calypogeia fissa]